ncbi:serine hydrolase domain-containing protein [Kitasatospora cinereorecta]|uniref:Serine hydrolase domain-containing protein n=1 Tax=Kitasatospora cinereorecta TaxID=285560 RepID=A0ABW0V9U3_9ACTN
MSLTTHHQPTNAWASAAAAKLGESLDAAVRHGNVPGGVVVIGQVATSPKTAHPNGGRKPNAERIVLSRGVVAAECGDTRPDADTLYDMASLTKVTATWLLVGRAVRDGLLDLDAPLSSYLPKAPAPGRDLTIRHLMSHTSGLLPNTGLARYSHSSRPLIDHLCAEPLISEPGARHRYIDRGFILLGLLLPILLGRPLHVLAAELWRDIGLTSTVYGPLARSPRVAPTEARLLGAPRTWGTPHDPSAALLGGVAGHAGVFSTASDLATFAEHLLASTGPDSVWFEESRRPLVDVEPGLQRGLAWIVTADGRAAYHHGYTGTSLYLSPATGRYIVLCTNAVYHGWDRARLTPTRSLALLTITSSDPDG